MRDEYDMTGGTRGRYYEKIWQGLDPKEIRVDVYRNSSPTIAMRVTHSSTGMWTEGKGISTIKLQEDLLRELAQKVAEYNAQKAKRENQSQL